MVHKSHRTDGAPSGQARTRKPGRQPPKDSPRDPAQSRAKSETDPKAPAATWAPAKDLSSETLPVRGARPERPRGPGKGAPYKGPGKEERPKGAFAKGGAHRTGFAKPGVKSDTRPDTGPDTRPDARSGPKPGPKFERAAPRAAASASRPAVRSKDRPHDRANDRPLKAGKPPPRAYGRDRAAPSAAGAPPAPDRVRTPDDGYDPTLARIASPASPAGGGDVDGASERVAKALARAGVASRREIEQMIAEGRVALNGVVLTTPAVKVDPGDILTVDGAVVSDAEPARLFRYHKPIDLITSQKDPKGRRTVFDALPEGLPRLISVGRLDINSEGLLLLTNDGGLARALELPASGVVRRYRARARGRVTQDRLDKLKNGITVEGVVYGPIEAHLDKAKDGPQGANLWITVTLTEGKNREVRRVLEALNLTVNRLIRLSYGPFALGTLAPGEVEEVGPRVIREQLAEHIAPQNLPTGERPQFKMPAAAPRAGPRRGATELDRRPGGAKPHRDKRGRAAADGPSEPKKVFKAGWAKPKPPKAITKRPPGKTRGPKKT